MTERARTHPTAPAGVGRRIGWLWPIAGIALSASVAGAAAPASRDAERDWSRYIIGLLPAIEACTRDAPARPVVVTGAYQMDDGNVGVRLRGPGEKRWACTAPANGGEASGYEPLAPGDRRPGEGDPLLTFDEPPKGACRTNDPVVEPSTGQLMGWLSYRSC